MLSEYAKTMISKIEVYQVDLPYSGGVYRLSGGRTFRSFDATIVGITDDHGRQGWGESTPFGSTYVEAHASGVRAATDVLAPAILGYNACHTDQVLARMDEVLQGHRSAKTALDVACWDLFGKTLGAPVCELLGGRRSANMPLISSIHAGTPDDMRSRVDDHRRMGYLGHSIKIGATEEEGGPKLDAARIEACLKGRQPGEFFIVDANGGLTVEYALRLLRQIPPESDFVLEAPCATLSETKALRAHSDWPLYMDELARSEQDVITIITEQLAEGIGLKISKNGGLTACRQQRDFCLTAGLSMSVQDTVGSELAFAAILHMAHSVPPEALSCVLDTRAMVTRSTGQLDFEFSDGLVAAGKAPGLGFSPDLNVLGEPVASFSL